MGIIRAGLVHEEQRHFPVKVDVLVIVPVVLGRLDSIAHKHDGRIDVRHLRLALVVGYEIDQVLGLEGFPAGLRELEGGFRKRLHARHRHGLEKSSVVSRSEEHTSELQSRLHLVCRLLLEKKKTQYLRYFITESYRIVSSPCTYSCDS